MRDLLVPIAALAGVVVAILVVQAWMDRETPAARPSGEYSALNLGPAGKGSPRIGEPAPGFRLLDTGGTVVTLEDFRGRPVLLNFWASWCIPCKRETPDLVELQAEWGETTQVVGVNYAESADTARDFADNFSINYPLPLDTMGDVAGAYKLTGLPETFFVDGQGIIRDHRIGQLRPAVARCIVAGLQAGKHDPGACR